MKIWFSQFGIELCLQSWHAPPYLFQTQLLQEGAHQASLAIETSDKAVDCDEAQQTPQLPLRWLSQSRCIVSALDLPVKIFGSDRCGSPQEACAKMMVEEQSHKRSESFLQKHPRLQPNMRSVLLDWLMEVRLQLSVFYAADSRIRLFLQWFSTSFPLSLF